MPGVRVHMYTVGYIFQAYVHIYVCFKACVPKESTTLYCQMTS